MLARVDEVLHNLDQLSLCVSLIRQTGAYHRRFQGFKPKYFKVRQTFKIDNGYILMEEVKVLEWYVFEENVIPLFVSQYFEEPFLGMVKTTLGSRYTAQIEVIVARTLKTFLTLCYFNLN